MSLNTAAEGTQVPLHTANKPQLRAFAQHLGVTVTNFDSVEKLRQKIKDSGWEETYIVAFDDAQAPNPKAKAAPAASTKEVSEPMVSLTVHQQEGPGGKRPVFVGVNGRAILIPRNKQCEVKLRYLVALQNAVETKYEYDDEAKANMPIELPSYPHQVHRAPSDEEKARWYAYEAAQEAKARRRDLDQAAA